ncbi:MAG TPA: type II toxin-antitoxin system VapC family toxin [Caulobacteraceae bacterium]|nr:type II toxin-antitoxin system VapC family toxin [Caulobacteraceae bacterium]
MSLVLDASMAIAWLFGEVSTEAADQVMRRVATRGAFVPSLWRLEVANVLRSAVRRGRCDEGYADQSLGRLARMPIRLDDETDAHAWGAIRVLSREEDLTPYDAAYLELALRRGLPMASNDVALIAAAGRRGVENLAA